MSVPFSSPSTIVYPTLSYLDTVLACSIWDSYWLSQKTVHTSRLFINVWSEFFCSAVYLRSNYFDSQYASIISDPNDIGQTLCLFFVDVISPFTNCILPFEAFIVSWVDRENSQFLREHQVPIVIVLSLMHPIFSMPSPEHFICIAYSHVL